MSETSEAAATPEHRDVSGILRGLDSVGKRRTAQEVAVENIRRAIVSGRLAGGTKLPQTQLAAEMELSTTPVREALRVLAAEGLVEFDPHHGAMVRSVDSEEMMEVYHLRSLLEPYCMRLAAKAISDEELNRTQELLEAMEAETDVSKWIEYNREFHTALCHASRSRNPIWFLSTLRASSAIYVGLSLRRAANPMVRGNREHRLIWDAVASHDADQAAEMTLLHVNALKEALGGALEEPPTTERK